MAEVDGTVVETPLSPKEAFFNHQMGIVPDVVVDPAKADVAIPPVDATIPVVVPPVEIDLNEPFSLSELAKEEPVTIDKIPEGLDEFINKKFGTHSIKSLADVETTVAKVKQLETELAEANKKTGQPTFANEQGRKLYEYCQAFDGTNAQKIAEFDRLQTLDVASMSETDAIKELYLIENRGLGYAKAERKFLMDFEDFYDSSKLSTEGLDPIDDAATIKDINRQIERRNINREQKAIEAREKIAQHVNTHKMPTPTKADAQAEPDMTKIKESMGKMVTNVGTELGGAKTLTFNFGKGEQDNVNITPDEKDWDKLNNMVADYYSNPFNYNEDGTMKVPMFNDPKTLVKTFIRNVFTEQYESVLIRKGRQLEKAETLKAAKPKVAGEPVGMGKEDSMEGMTDKQKLAHYHTNK